MCICDLCNAERKHLQEAGLWRDPLNQPSAIWGLKSDNTITFEINGKVHTAPPWIAEVIRRRTGYDR